MSNGRARIPYVPIESGELGHRGPRRVLGGLLDAGLIEEVRIVRSMHRFEVGDAALDALLGDRFHVYGSNWAARGVKGSLPFDAQEQAIRTAWVSAVDPPEYARQVRANEKANHRQDDKFAVMLNAGGAEIDSDEARAVFYRGTRLPTE